VPGPITTPTSQGTHHLLKQGAKLVTSVEDILEELRLTPQPARPRTTRVSAHEPAELAEEEQRVFACLSHDEPRYIDTIAAESGMAASDVAALLLQLELRHLIQQLPGKQFIRTR